MTPTITVATYNMRRALGMDHRIDLRRIASVVEGLEADVVVLNEVELWGIRSRFGDQAKQIGEWAGLHVFECAGIRFGPYRFGNAILTRQPPIETRCVKLPRPRIRDARSMRERVLCVVVEPRSAAVVNVPVRGTDWVVVGTHLGLTPMVRRGQVAAIVRLLPELGERTVIAGDLNTTNPEAEDVAALFSWGAPLGPAVFPTFPSDRPREQRDYVIAGPGCAIITARTHPVQYSDHVPIVAVVSQQESRS